MSVKPELRQLAVVHMLAERLLQTADASGLMSPLYRASAASALAETRGDLEAALTQYGQAVGGWAERANVLEHGMALLGEGRCLYRLGSSSDAAVEETDGWLSPA